METYRVVLMTDIVDSTRVSASIGNEATARLWAAHDDMARSLLRQWHGLEIERTDGIVAVFADVHAALGYAMDYHRSLTFEGHALKARVAIDTGELSVRTASEEDIALGARRFEVDGLAKPIAARLLAIAQAGQTLLTQEAAAAEPLRFPVRTHGHWQLKGLSRPIELLEAGDADAPFTPPAEHAKAYRVVLSRDLWVPARDIPRNLPAERDAFVGRDLVLAQVGHKIDAGARLLSIVGVGGAGKTRLALRYAWMSLGEWAGGVWFCDLSQARTLDGVYFAVAQGLGVALNHADPATQIARVLAGRGACLVILDNFEQIANVAEQTVGQWLDQAREATFVVTTRETLRIVGEQTLALAAMSTEEGTTLFLQRAESVRQDYAPPPDDLAAIRALVGRLDGLPLALELAAVRVRFLPPRALLARLHERFDLLAAPSGRLGRQATLRAAFDWSWQLLSEAEKAALAQLSVFEGGFTLGAAGAVLAPLRSAHTPDFALVESLSTKSFVHQVSEDRFHLLESVRQYADEHLGTEGRYAASGPPAKLAAQRRHWTYYAAIKDTETVGVRIAEANNLVAACRRATEAGEGHAAVGCLLGAWSVLRLTGPLRVGATLAADIEAYPELDPVDRALAHWVGGSALELLGEVDAARRHFLAGLAAAHSTDDAACRARLLMSLGARQTVDGELELAYDNLHAAGRLADIAAEPLLQAQVLNVLGRLMDHQSRLPEARRAYEQALVIARRIADRRLEGGLLGNLGGLHHDQGQLTQARDLYDEALALSREVGDRRWEGNTQSNLGLLSQEEGRLEEARARFEQALKIAREIGHATLEYTVLCNLGIVLDAEGRPGEAMASYLQAVDAARHAEDRRAEGQYQGYLALTCARMGRLADAHHWLERGEKLLLEMSDQLSLGILKCQQAEVEWLDGHHDRARLAHDAAASIAAGLHAGADSELGRRLAVVRRALETQPARR